MNDTTSIIQKQTNRLSNEYELTLVELHKSFLFLHQIKVSKNNCAVGSKLKFILR